MEKMKKIKGIIGVIAFLLIGAILFQLVSVVLLPDWFHSYSSDANQVKSLYEEPKNSLDALFIGDSSVYMGVSPLEIWKDTGYATYCLSTPGQRTWISYYILKEALQYQHPKFVILDMNETFNAVKADELATRKVFDNMKWGKTKWEALNDPTFQLSNYDKLTYLFPVLRYHSRWGQIQSNDFRRMRDDYYSTFKGYVISKQIKKNSKKSELLEQSEKDTNSQIQEDSLVYLKKIQDLCQENNTQLILTAVPSLYTLSENRSHEIQEYANQNGLIYFNLEDHANIDWDEDSIDGGYHLNTAGASKVTKCITECLEKTGQIQSHQQDSSYQKWNEDLEIYEETLQKIKKTEVKET